MGILNSGHFIFIFI